MSGARSFHVAAVLVLATTLSGSFVTPTRAASFSIPNPKFQTLDNGLKVAVFQDSRLPIIQIQLLIDAGTVSEPEDSPGVAGMTAEMLLRGTSSRSAGAFAVELDAMPGSLEATATRDYATLDGAFLARHLDSAVELMSDCVVNPLFAEADIRQLQTRTMSGILNARRNPGAFADEQLWAAVFPGHPYGRPLAGVAESIARMNRERILSFYLAQYRPDHATLAIAGDVTPERAFAAAREWFGRWSAKPGSPAPPVSAPAPRVGLTIRVVDMPGSPVSQVRVGTRAPARGSEDEAAFTLANALFGGNPESRLGKSAPGTVLAGARSAYTLLKQGGLFACALTVPSDSVAAAVSRVRAAMRRFTTTPPDEAELAPVRKTSTEVFPMRFETLGGVIGYWSGSTFSGRGADAAEYQDRVAAVRAADVAAVSKRWLDAGQVAVVVVGPVAKIKPALERLGKVEVVSLETGRAEAATGAPSVGQQAHGREIVRLALVAHGGLLRLKRIADSIVESNATISAGDREVQGEITQIRKEPNRMRVTMQFEGVSTIQAVVANRGWMGSEAMADSRTMDSSQVAGMRAGFGTDVPHLLLAAAAPSAKVIGRGREMVANREADVVEVVTTDAHRVLYVDVENHHLLGMDQHESASGVGFTARRLYGDYRRVQGVSWPYLEERQLDGRRVMLLEVKRVVLDSGVENAVFEQRGIAPPLPAR